MKEDKEYTMYKKQFVFTKQEEGEIGLAECPHCQDAVVWNKGCIKCNATFTFQDLEECWACFKKLPKGHKSGLCSDCQIRG